VAASQRLAEVPEELVQASSLPDPAYVDAFAIDLASAAPSAEGRARSVFEGAPVAMRWFMVVGWRLGLGLRLGPRTPEHVLGWRITGRGGQLTDPRAAILDALRPTRVLDQQPAVHASDFRPLRQAGGPMAVAARLTPPSTHRGLPSPPGRRSHRLNAGDRGRRAPKVTSPGPPTTGGGPRRAGVRRRIDTW
jgi:hypothetical protein